jgi:hypothetical protein
MRTLNTQVRLRRLIRAFGEAVDRLASEPQEREHTGSVVARLMAMAEAVRDAWQRESELNQPAPPLEAYVAGTLRAVEYSISGLDQAGSDPALLKQDFESAAWPLEYFLRGLDAEPALQRTA